MNRKDIESAFYNQEISLKECIDRILAWQNEGNWTPANNGTEKPFTTRSGRRLLYCYQQRSGRHAYLDMGTDLILTDEEARLALAM